MRQIILLLFSLHLTAQTWLQHPDLPSTARDDGIAVSLNNKVYVGTGLTSGWAYAKDFYVFDPATASWSAIPDMPDGTERQYACGFAGPGCFFVFAGDGINGPLNSLYKFDLSNNSWSVMSPKPGNGLIGAACLAYGDKTIICGGKALGNGMPSNEVWEYSISGNSWSQKNNFPFGGRFRASAAVIYNTGYILFGLDAGNRFRKEMYKYNQFTDGWTKVLDFPQTLGRAYASLQCVDDKLVLFGGYDSLNVYHKDVWQYNPLALTWTQMSDFPSFGRKGGMSAVAGNKFFYSCGINVSDTRLKESWSLDIPLGLKENKINEIVSVFPNPCSDILYASLKSGQETEIWLHFTEITGKTIKIKKYESSGIYVGDLEQGLYFLNLYAGDRYLGTSRLVKTN